MEENKAPETKGLDIKEALEKLNVGYVEATVTERDLDDGAIELEFVNEHTGGFVFEDQTSFSAQGKEEVQQDQPIFTEPIEETAPLKIPAIAEPTEEFSVPEYFEINEKYNTPEIPNEQTSIWKTYVPRFTDVSDTYRMANDPRPRAATPIVESVAQSDLSKIDPTAELDSEPDGAVEVTTDKTARLEDYSETLNVYKFGEDKTDSIPVADKAAAAQVAENPVPSVEKVPTAPTEERTAPIEEPVEEPAAEEAELPHEKKGPVAIPDPTAAIHMIDCDEASPKSALTKYEIPPRGITPAPVQDGKRDKLAEYTAFYQRDSFKDKFLDGILSLKIRLFSLAFLAIVLVVYEGLGLFGVDVAQLLRISGTNGALSFIDLHLSFCAFALALPEIVGAVKLLFKKQLIPEFALIPAFLIVGATVLEDFVSMDATPELYGSVLAVSAFVAVYGSCVRRKSDFTAFKAVSQNGEKKALDISETRTLPKENLALDGAVDSYKSGTVRLFRTSFISDFFKRIARRKENTFNNVVILAVSIGAALVLSTVVGLIYEGIPAAFDAFAITFFAAIPAFSILVHKLPYARAERVSNDNKTVIIGESSLYEFTDADVITFEDTEIFGTEDVVLKRFMLYGDKENMTKAMRQMSALFSVVGGPLDSIFANSLDKRPAPATNPVIEEDGISGNVDGKRVCAGTFEYMKRNGITVHRDSGSSESSGADTIKVIYSAEGGTVYAKFYIRYSFSEAFSEMLPAIRDNNIIPLIYTRDPNISNDLLKTLTMGKGVMRVMKKSDLPSSETKNYTRLDAGVVTFGDKMNAIRAVLLAKKYSALQQKLAKAELILMGVGTFAAIVLSLFRLAIPSVAVVAWQILCCIGLRIAASRYLSPDKKSKG